MDLRGSDLPTPGGSCANCQFSWHLSGVSRCPTLHDSAYIGIPKAFESRRGHQAADSPHSGLSSALRPAHARDGNNAGNQPREARVGTV